MSYMKMYVWDDRRSLEQISQLLDAIPLFILGEFVIGISG
jgi:hypothetical protein